MTLTTDQFQQLIDALKLIAEALKAVAEAISGLGLIGFLFLIFKKMG
jgi:hypothetical protein